MSNCTKPSPCFAGLRASHGLLSFYVEFALDNHREPVSQKPLSEAITAYTAEKQHEREQDLLSAPHFTRIKRDLKRLQRQFKDVTVSEVTSDRLRAYLEADRTGAKTFNNRCEIVSTFLKFALHREWIAEDPLKKSWPGEFVAAVEVQ
ncbi:MAG: hypothetical protein WC205_03190 [Opitutaceae bacterium]|jgi:hypothetical protein